MTAAAMPIVKQNLRSTHNSPPRFPIQAVNSYRVQLASDPTLGNTENTMIEDDYSEGEDSSLTRRTVSLPCPKTMMPRFAHSRSLPAVADRHLLV